MMRGITKRIGSIKFSCVSPEEGLDGADVVILAVPDTAIGKVAAGIADRLKPGTMVVALDAAAPFAGHLPQRADLTYFVTHPCHPPIFNDETDEAARADHFGGIAAKQHIVNALMQGPEAHYAVGEEVARAIYYLCTSESSYVTGAELEINGGQHV